MDIHFSLRQMKYIKQYETFFFEEDFEEEDPSITTIEGFLMEFFGKDDIVVKISNDKQWRKFVDAVKNTNRYIARFNKIDFRFANTSIRWNGSGKTPSYDYELNYHPEYLYISTEGKMTRSKTDWYMRNRRKGNKKIYEF